MRILITNDDGINAEGLAVLERIAGSISDDVWVVAPETDQSGLAHSFSLSEPLRLRKLDDRHFALRGTPTDCVIMAVNEIIGGKPDLVLSGVNAGANMADDVTYSGTVAGAMEGALLGIPSIALSQEYRIDGEHRLIPWETAEIHAPELLQRLIAFHLGNDILLNVNFPACPPDEVGGYAVTRQGKLAHGLGIERRKDGRGLPYYWIRIARREENVRSGSDLSALRDKKITITPLKLDLTDEETRTALQQHLQ